MKINGLEIDIQEIQNWLAAGKGRSVDITIINPNALTGSEAENNKIWAYDFILKSGIFIKSTADLPTKSVLLKKAITTRTIELNSLTEQDIQEVIDA